MSDAYYYIGQLTTHQLPYLFSDILFIIAVWGVFIRFIKSL